MEYSFLWLIFTSTYRIHTRKIITPKFKTNSFFVLLGILKVDFMGNYS